MASTLLSPMVDYYNDEEELDSVDDDDDRSFRGRDSEEGNEFNNISRIVGLCLVVGENGNARLLYVLCAFFHIAFKPIFFR